MTSTDTSSGNMEIYRQALAAAASSLERLGPHAIAQRSPDGAGWVVDVHQADRDPDHPDTPPAHFHIDSMESDPGAFPPASAGFRLIEHGWMTHSAANFAAGRMGAWRYDEATDTYTAPVHSTRD